MEGLPINKQTFELTEELKKKCTNLFYYVEERVVLLGEYAKRREELGKAFDTVVIDEIYLTAPVVVMKMAELKQWTYEKVNNMEENEVEQHKLYEDVANLIQEVSKSQLKMEETFKFKSYVEENEKEKKKFWARMFRYYLYFAEVALKLIPEAIDAFKMKDH